MLATPPLPTLMSGAEFVIQDQQFEVSQLLTGGRKTKSI